MKISNSFHRLPRGRRPWTGRPLQLICGLPDGGTGSRPISSVRRRVCQAPGADGKNKNQTEAMNIKETTNLTLDIEPLEDRIAPSGLGACLSTAPAAEQAHPVDVNVAPAAMAASGHGVVSVAEGLCE
ncbi:MAG: hypothetical protein AB1705_22855 [Verrucomicrobiota bacterium]